MEEPFAAQPTERLASVATSIDPGSVPDIDHYELDGIPLYHVPTPGATMLMLAFRVGRADEPVIRGGMTHLAEHLILTSINDALDHSNGSTEPFRVTFVVRGSPAHASRFLRDVCAAIERPRVSRMHEESKVLRTEAAGRGGMGMSLRLMWMRTGYQGIGTLSLPELFLDQLDESVLHAWMAEHLVAGNAALWISGELPDDLTVSLPPGPRKAPPDIRWIDGFETPTVVIDQAPGVGASFYVERSVATTSAIRALGRQLTKRTRVDRGLAYEVGGEYMPVDRHHALASVWLTCLPEATREVQQILLESIDDIANRGPSDDELSADFERFARDVGDPAAIPGRLDSQVRDVLLGGDPVPTPVASLLDEQWRLESAHVAAAMHQARESMLLLLPESGVDPQRPFQRYPGPPMGPMGDDRTFELITKEKRGFLRKSDAPRLSVGRAGVAIDAANGARIMGVRWSDCVGIIHEPDIRSILGRDGTVLQVFVSDWRDGGSAVRQIDKHSPADLVVRAAP